MFDPRLLVACFASVALVAQPLAAQEAAGRPVVSNPAHPEALRLVDIWLDSVQVYGRLPALSSAIVQGDRIVWSKGYGGIDAARRTPATAQTLYSICSISKLFTSVAIMQQWETGKVSLDVPLTTYLPWATLKRSPSIGDSTPVTLRGVLSHSSGLPQEADIPYWSPPDYPFPTQAQLRASLSDLSPVGPAGRQYHYSNLGLALVGETVAAVAREPYADYVQTRILDPLGLKDTHPFLPMNLYGTRLAVGWGALDRGGNRALLQPFDARALTPAAGYASTVEDLGRFAAWQFRLLRSETPEVLKVSTLRELHRVQYISQDRKIARGLGFEVTRSGDHTYVGTTGNCPGYNSNLSLRPETETAIATALTGSELATGYNEAIFALLDKRNGFGFRGPAIDPGAGLEAYAGRYTAQPYAAEAIIVPWAGGLALLQLPSQNPASSLMLLRPMGRDRFRIIREDGSEADEVRFERNAAGQIIRYIYYSNPNERTGPV